MFGKLFSKIKKGLAKIWSLFSSIATLFRLKPLRIAEKQEGDVIVLGKLFSKIKQGLAKTQIGRAHV